MEKQLRVNLKTRVLTWYLPVGGTQTPWILSGPNTKSADPDEREFLRSVGYIGSHAPTKGREAEFTCEVEVRDQGRKVYTGHDTIVMTSAHTEFILDSPARDFLVTNRPRRALVVELRNLEPFAESQKRLHIMLGLESAEQLAGPASESFAGDSQVAEQKGIISARLQEWLPERLHLPDTTQKLQALAGVHLPDIDDDTLKANVESLLARMGRLAGLLHTEPIAPEPAVYGALVQMLRAFDFEPDELALLEQHDLSEPEDTVSIPPGVRVPERSEVTVSRFARNPDVARTVRRLANGTCECCQGAAPFRDSSGVPFLEVHHVVRLADGGEDTVENAAAVCPNCHRELHHGAERNEKVKVLRRNIAKRRAR